MLPGGRRAATSFAGLLIVAAPQDDPPFDVEAVACEEDTWLALSTETRVVRSPGHPVRVMTRVWEARPEPPGSVLVRSGTPLRLLAVVHDLDAEPTWREEWIESALAAILAEVVGRRLVSIAMPLLGTKHGALEPARFMRLLGRALAEGVPSDAALRQIWVVRDKEPAAEILAALEGAGGDEPARRRDGRPPAGEGT
ncbi:MAG TPA: hypothetical protein VGD06_03835 [Acidobacteriota bacterium]